MAERAAPNAITTHEYMNEALAEFAPEPTPTMQHVYETPLLDPTDAIPTPHVLVARVMHPFTVDEATNTFGISGERRLVIRAFGEQRALTSTPQKDTEQSTLPSAFVVGGDPNYETPVLSLSEYTFNTKRTLRDRTALYADGGSAGLTEPVDLLEAFKQFYGTRSASLQTIAGMTVRASMACGTSVRELHTQFSPQDVARTIARQSDLKVPPSLRRGTTNIRLDYRSQVTPTLGGTLTSTEHFVVDHLGLNPKTGQFVRTSTDFGVLHAHRLLEGTLGQLADEEHSGFTTDLRALSLGWMSGISKYTVQQARTINLRVGGGSIKHTEHAIGETATEIRELLAPTFLSIAGLRRFKRKATRTAA